jgi:hypothetical protein
MISLDFEFTSTHRNRNLWPNQCLFEVPWSGSGQSYGLNSVDPVSNQVPTIVWVGENIDINATVLSRTDNSLVVYANVDSFSQLKNYYQGAELISPSLSSYRINESKFISQNGGLDYLQLNVTNSDAKVGDVITIKVNLISNTLFVPEGSDWINSYVNQYLYNETLVEFTKITDYDVEYHKIIASIPGTWLITNKYSIRPQLPTVGNFSLNGGNTTNQINLTGIEVDVNPGDFIRIVSTNEIVKIINYDFDTHYATVFPLLSSNFAAGTKIELLSQTSDNYRTLSYSGTLVGQQEQVSYNISLVSATLPNIPIKNGIGGYPSDYPYLYVEFYDTNFPTQNNLFSNNHSNKSYFKVTTPTGQLMSRKEKFTKFTGDLNHKTIRFRPTSNFRVVWRLPTNEIINFEELDSKSPSFPKEHLQTSVMFNLQRN